MPKKDKGSKRSGRQVTPLDELQRNRNVIASPMAKLGNFSFSSWINEVLPDALWSVLLAGLLPREKALAAFRLVLTLYKRNKEALGETMLVHSQLAPLAPHVFYELFRPLCEDDETRDALTCLLVLETLPDRHHWESLISSRPTWDQAGERLAVAVARSFDHQSQAATDCRWLRVMTLLAQEKLFFDEKLGNRFDELVQYPNKGDMRQVRPHVRALEMMTRSSDSNKNAPAAWNEVFWMECWKSTHCIPSHRDIDARRMDHTYLFKQIVSIHDSLSNHFLATVRTTGIDARHDGCFGLTFYVIHLLTYALKSATGQTVASRSMLRTALEAYITLSFLAKKDDDTVWMQYRNYGYGQTKLAFLKNLKLADIPSFLTIEMLESIVNEDMWIEFQDIKLGAWADKNLRRMAEDADVKDTYDRYYDTLSGYVHGNWTAVRHSVFGECLNPLHRFHRIPLPPREFEEDAVPDLVKFANLCLERLTALYPPFKPRFRLEAKRAEGQAAAEAPRETKE